MVECEYGSDEKMYAEQWCFNRYMVECESLFNKEVKMNGLVLIDTWWNVNCVTNSKDKEKVDSFNRYMVECESFQCFIHGSLFHCFNRYMVECEL